MAFERPTARVRARPVVLALVCLAPAALAHGASHGFVQANVAGDKLVTLSLGPDLPVAGIPLPITMKVEESKTRLPVPNLTVTYDAREANQTAFVSNASAPPYAGFPHYYDGGNLTFPKNGTFQVVVRLPAAEAVFTADVYPNIPYRVDYLGPAQVASGRPLSAAFAVTRHPTGELVADVPDPVVVLEEWTFDHSREIARSTLALTKGEDSLYHAAPVFDREAMYHIYFTSASLGIPNRATPMAHVVVSPPADSPPTNDAPLGGVLALLGPLLVGAMISKRKR